MLSMLPCPAFPAEAGRQLAVDSLDFIGRMEAMLDGAIRSGSAADYERFVFQPTLAQMNKWPPLSEASHLRYRRCQFAVDAFRNYADASFKAGARIDGQSIAAKDYAGQKALCKQSVK